MTDSEVLTLGSALEGAPGSIADLSAAACQYVEQAVGIGVDFTAETLPVVDHYITLAREEVADRPELLSLVTRAVGAYFGQVAVRGLGGFWRVPHDDDHEWLVCLRRVLLAFNPVGIAHDVLLQGAGNGPSAEIYLAKEERDVVFKRLEALPRVRDAEYFMLATRLEALQIAAAALSELADAGTADVDFEWEDYQDLVPNS